MAAKMKPIPTPDDLDPEETQEWLEAIESVLEYEGPERAQFLLEQLVDKTRRSGGQIGRAHV